MRKPIAALGSAAAALSVIAVAACGGANNTASGTNSSAAARKGGTLTILYSATTLALDPAKSWSLAITSSGLLFRRLTTWKIGRTGTPQVVPDLANLRRHSLGRRQDLDLPPEERDLLQQWPADHVLRL
jgi:peptide/nickel transport system substrate-binding protein